MKVTLKILLLVVATTFLLTSCGDSAANISLQEYSSTKLSNSVLLHTMPTADRYGQLMSLNFRLQASALNEQAHEAGFSSLTTRLLALPTGDMKKEAYRFYVENQQEAIYLSVECLVEDLKPVMDICLEKLSLNIDESAFLAVKNQLIADLQSRAGDKEQEVNQTINRLLFSGTSLEHTIAEKIAALQEADFATFKTFANRNIRPESTHVALVGQFNRTDLQNGLSSLTSWHGGATVEPVELRIDPKEFQNEFTILDAETDFATIYILRNLPNPPAEDYYALQAVNFVLNGARVGARFGQLDEAMGRADAVESIMRLNSAASANVIVAKGQVDQALLMTSQVRRQLELLLRGTLNNQRIMDQELLDSKNYLTNQLHRSLQSPRQLGYLLLWSYNLGFLDPTPAGHLQMIANLDKRKLEAAIDVYFNREVMVNALLLVGPEEELKNQFQSWENADPQQP